jgi:predicted patatin/cPLA2 family phospholipase|tara:strand:- start:25 stop:249 length:225 start_codon:yes stop_codon:yes gene_type:complete
MDGLAQFIPLILIFTVAVVWFLTLEKGNKNVTKVVRNEPSSSNLGARLKKLRQMYKDGILSKVEFEKAKNKLLK